MIEFDRVTRRYGRRLAVDGLDLIVRPGEVFALLGPNGAGKTTAIRMLVGLLRPDAGAVRVCGCDVASRTRYATHCLGYVPEEAFLYDKLTGREFLEFSAEMRGLDRATVRQRIARESDRFSLVEFLDRLIETYSHGMKQRLVFASALLHDPAVLVTDEPTVGLDPLSIRVIKDLLREQAAAGRTILMSTHTLAVAEEIADRIGVIDSGRLRFRGTLADLRLEMAAPGAALEPLFLELTSGNHKDENAAGRAQDSGV